MGTSPEAHTAPALSISGGGDSLTHNLTSILLLGLSQQVPDHVRQLLTRRSFINKASGHKDALKVSGHRGASSVLPRWCLWSQKVMLPERSPGRGLWQPWGIVLRQRRAGHNSLWAEGSFQGQGVQLTTWGAFCAVIKFFNCIHFLN